MPYGIFSHVYVFGGEGIWLGTVVLPDRFDLYDIGDDYVLGRWQDDLDVVHVQLYELVKPEQSPASSTVR